MGQNKSLLVDDQIRSRFQSETESLPREWYDQQLIKRCENVHFDVENWYNVIKSETFYTEFIEICPLVAQAFVNFYETRYTSQKSLDMNDIQLIQSIETQLKEKLFNFKRNTFENKNSFIRLSSRSPKDGKPLDSRKIHQFYNQKVKELEVQYPDQYKSIESKANLQMIAYCYAQFHSLKVTNEIEALNLILSSERVYYDLIEVLDCQKVQNNQIENINHRKIHDWNNNIVIRQWNDFLDPSMEFRCFVYQSHLTAISQYNNYCKYYHLQDHRIIQRIKETIINYFEQRIQPLLDPYSDKYSNYVIDIGLIEKNEMIVEYDCIVIEMNPFETSTGASLFDWTNDNDQLKGQGNEIEIRIQKNYYPYIEDYIQCILETNQFNEDQNLFLSLHRNMEPYGVFLNQIKEELTQQLT